MEFMILTEEEFRNFSDTHPLKNFIQTPEMAHIRKQLGYEYWYIGVKEKEEIKAATMIGAKTTRFGKKEFYAPRGLLIDYEDSKLLQFFTDSIKKFVKENDGYVFRIDPYYLTKERDIDGKEVSNGFNHSLGIENLKKLGYRKCKNVYQIFTYMFSKDLNTSKEEIYKSFHSLPKRMIKKAEESKIIIREATFEELEKVQKLIDETGERKNFHSRNLDYYQLLYQNFYPRNEVKFMLGEIDVNLYKSIKKDKIQVLEKELENMKTDKKKEECNNKIEKEKKDLEEVSKLDVDSNGKFLLSAGVFLLYGEELVYLFGGNKKQFMHYGSSYKMQWEMMQYGLEHGFKKYNFYGIPGMPSKEDGVYNFKRGFDGYIEELIGDYEYPVSFYYYIHKLIHIIKR